MSNDLLKHVVGWRKEPLPLSKKDLVHEISQRLEPIVANLIERIDSLDKRINNITLQQRNIINYVCQNKSHRGYFTVENDQ